MTNLKQELQLIEEQLEQLDEQIKSHCIAWAQEKALSLVPEEIPQDIGILQKTLEDFEGEEKRVAELTGERESLQERQKEIREQEAADEKSLAEFYVLLGRRSFDLYKRGSLPSSPGVEDLFKTLLDWEDRIRDADNELYRIRTEGEDLNLWKRMGSFIKKSSQSTKKRSAGENLSRNYRRIGERLVRDGLLPEIAGNGLSDLFEEHKGHEEATRRLKEESLKLDERLGDLDRELEEICGGVKPSRFLKKREEEKDRKEGELDEAFLRMGQSLYVREDLEGESFKHQIEDLNNQRETKIREKTLCLTEIRIGELEELLQKKIRDRAQQQEKVDRETEKLNVLAGETEDLEKKKKQLEKEKGDLTSSLSV